MGGGGARGKYRKSFCFLAHLCVTTESKGWRTDLDRDGIRFTVTEAATSNPGNVPLIPPPTCCPDARTVFQDVTVCVRAATAAAAVTAEVPTAPTGSRTVTTPTSPTGTTHSAASNPTGITQHSPHTLALALNPAVSGGRGGGGRLDY